MKNETQSGEGGKRYLVIVAEGILGKSLKREGRECRREPVWGW